MNDDHANVQRAQDIYIEQDVREIFIGDDRAVNGYQKRLFAEARDILQDAPKVGQFHLRTFLSVSIQRLFSAGVPTEMRINSGN